MTRQRTISSLNVACCVCLGLLCSSVALGQERERNQQAQDRERQQSGQTGQQQGQQQTDPSAGPVELPQFLQKLDLDSDQKEQIKQALTEHNQKLQQTWKEFHKQHARAINLEAVWVAAVRDSLSEDDQRKFDQQRLQQREMTRHSQEGASQQRGPTAQRRQETREGRQQEAERRQQEARESAETRQSERRERREERSGRQQAGSSAQEQSSPSQSADEYTVVVITTFSPERFLQGTSQSEEQQEQCSEACRQYKQALSSVWQELHRLHYELVQIEADRIQAVEEQLTEEQLNKLRESRQKPQAETAAADSPAQRNQQRPQ